MGDYSANRTKRISFISKLAHSDAAVTQALCRFSGTPTDCTVLVEACVPCSPTSVLAACGPSCRSRCSTHDRISAAVGTYRSVISVVVHCGSHAQATVQAAIRSASSSVTTAPDDMPRTRCCSRLPSDSKPAPSSTLSRFGNQLVSVPRAYDLSFPHNTRHSQAAENGKRTCSAAFASSMEENCGIVFLNASKLTSMCSRHSCRIALFTSRGTADDRTLLQLCSC